MTYSLKEQMIFLPRREISLLFKEGHQSSKALSIAVPYDL